MPYYVYAIRPDSRLNVFTDLLRITIRRKFEREKRGLGDSQGSSFVRLVYTENQTHAAQRVKQLRRERGLK